MENNRTEAEFAVMVYFGLHNREELIGYETYISLYELALDKKCKDIDRLEQRLVSGGNTAFDLHAKQCEEIAELKSQLQASTEEGTSRLLQWADMKKERDELKAKHVEEIETQMRLAKLLTDEKDFYLKEIEALKAKLEKEKAARLAACEVLANDEALQSLLKTRGDQEYADGLMGGEAIASRYKAERDVIKKDLTAAQAQVAKAREALEKIALEATCPTSVFVERVFCLSQEALAALTPLNGGKNE